MMGDVGLLTACFLTIADITPVSPESRQNRLQHGDKVQFVCSINHRWFPMWKCFASSCVAYLEIMITQRNPDQMRSAVRPRKVVHSEVLTS